MSNFRVCPHIPSYPSTPYSSFLQDLSRSAELSVATATSPANGADLLLPSTPYVGGPMGTKPAVASPSTGAVAKEGLPDIVVHQRDRFHARLAQVKLSRGAKLAAAIIVVRSHAATNWPAVGCTSREAGIGCA